MATVHACNMAVEENVFIVDSDPQRLGQSLENLGHRDMHNNPGCPGITRTVGNSAIITMLGVCLANCNHGFIWGGGGTGILLELYSVEDNDC